jgi:cytochrome c oxidase subunit 2
MEKTFFNNVNSNYEMFFTPAGSCQMDGIVSLYNYIMTYLTSILFIVTTALLFIIVIHLHGERHLKQFKNEEDLDELLNWMKYLQRWTHSTILELVWTIIPTIILIAIAIPSFILLYSLDEIVDTQSVVKIIAYQWYWKYEYPVMDINNDDVVTFSYLSYMLPFDDLTEEKNRRLLEVDAPLVLPTNVNSKLVITAKDVLHSFAIPALGIKMDAVPGRLNQVTVHIFKSGMFYGQCSELCGVNHGFMPIVLAAVDFNTFEHFLAECSGLEPQTPTPTPSVTPQPTPDSEEPEASGKKDQLDDDDLFDKPGFDREADFERILRGSDYTGIFPEGRRLDWLLFL